MAPVAGLMLIAFCGAAFGAADQEGKSRATANALERGMVAAQNKDWTTALRYLSQVLAKAPNHSNALFLSGIAHAQLGRPVPAALYLRAHLDASPKAPNREKVRRDIITLEIRAEGLGNRLFEQAIAATARIANRRQQREVGLTVIRELARAGAVDWALRIAGRYPVGAALALGEIAAEHNQAGRPELARRIIGAAENHIPAEARLRTDLAFDERSGYSTFPMACPAPPRNASPAQIRATNLRCTEEWKAYVRNIRSRSGARIEKATRGQLYVLLGSRLGRVGLRATAYRLIAKGARLIGEAGADAHYMEQNPLNAGPPGLFLARSEYSLAMTDGFGQIVSVDIKGRGIGSFRSPYRRSDRDAPPGRPATGPRRASALVKFGRMGFGHNAPSINDAAYVDLTGAVRSAKRLPADRIPSQLAILGGRLLGAVRVLGNL